VAARAGREGAPALLERACAYVVELATMLSGRDTWAKSWVEGRGSTNSGEAGAAGASRR
jgi:hypothetical protein